MSLTEGAGGLSAADVAAVTGGFGNNNGFFNGDGAWWLIILLLFANNGWGGGFGFGGGGMMPWMMGNMTTQNDVQRGFDQSAIMGGLNGITSALSSGFANAEISRCNANTNILQALNTNQAAVVSGMNSLAMGLQNCCCENRASVADLKYTVATEACADRQAVTNALFDVTQANNANTQALLNAVNNGIQSIQDKLCQQEIEALKTQNQNLQTQLNEANRRASQNDQTAQILASQAAQTAALEQYLRPVPSPAYIVQNPNCCPQTFGCGCAA